MTLAKLFNLSEPIISLKEEGNTCPAGWLGGLEITHVTDFRRSNFWQGPEYLALLWLILSASLPGSWCPGWESVDLVHVRPRRLLRRAL